MNLQQLRERHSKWSWTAERDGFGWMYRGTCDGDEVRLRAYSIADDYGDHYRTEWRDIDSGTNYEAWRWGIRIRQTANGDES